MPGARLLGKMLQPQATGLTLMRMLLLLMLMPVPLPAALNPRFLSCGCVRGQADNEEGGRCGLISLPQVKFDCSGHDLPEAAIIYVQLPQTPASKHNYLYDESTHARFALFGMLRQRQDARSFSRLSRGQAPS